MTLGCNLLTDDKLLDIVKDTRLHDKFPALHAIQKTLYTPPKKQGGCSKCQRNRLMKSNASIVNAVKAVKKYIKNMDTETRNKFKQEIGILDLRFTMTDADGRVKEFRY